MFRTEDENAKESFFYWKGDWGKNVLLVCSDTLIKNIISAKNFFSFAIMRGTNFFMRILYFFAGIFVTLGSVLFIPVLLSIFGATCLTIWLCYNVLALFFELLENVYLYIHRIYAICPTCNQRVDSPIYICPSCGSEQKCLLPTARYGIFRRTCACSTKLATSIFWGKNKLQGKCPHCGASRGVQMNFSPMTIAFIGGPSAGKTFLRDTMSVLLPVISSNKHWAYTLPLEDKPNWQAMEQRMRAGVLPFKTADSMSGNIIALRMDIRRTAQAITERLYLYDPPGESFKTEEKLDSYIYYTHLKTAVFVIDPMSFPLIRRRIPNVGTIGHISVQSPINCFQQWLVSMENTHFVGDLQRLAKQSKCAVVITKIDVPEFQNIVKLSAGLSSEQCREFLMRCDMSQLITMVEEYFSECCFFTVSCTGGVGPGQSFKPVGLEKVWSWILEK